MRYIILTSADVTDIEALGVDELLIEVLPDGSANREVGLDKARNVVHLYPGDGKFGTYGMLDNATVDLNGKSDDLSAAEFNSLYS